MWISAFSILYLSIDIVSSSVDYLQHPVKSCHIGDVVVNECNKCLCTSKAVFECAPIDCNKNKYRKEFEASKQLCYPNQLYVQNLITCICTKDGRWPHKSCHDTFQSLPPNNVRKHKCEPDTYVVIDCNVCRCGPGGEIDSDRCTRNNCEDDSKRRVNLGPNSVYSSCEVKNWYSLAPCQFCFCVNTNKLVCNTGNYYSKKLELGSYNLRICGKDLIREAIELIPDNQRALRLGLVRNNVTTTTANNVVTTATVATTTQWYVPEEDHNIAIEVNRESNENLTSKPLKIDENTSSDKEDYYTETEEEPTKLTKSPELASAATVTTAKTIITKNQLEKEAKGPSTKFPFEEGDEMLSESEIKNSDEDNEEESNEIVVEVEQKPIASTTPVAVNEISRQAFGEIIPPKNVAREGKSAESYQYVGNTLKINLPRVLNKVFQLALRKSMVSLTNESKCVPGSTSISNCNMCFCLKNSKLLCTNNRCDKQ